MSSPPRRCRYCERNAAPGRLDCYPCKYQHEKQRDGQRVAWHRLTSNARRRGIFCDLTLDDFREFAVESEVLLGRGRWASSWHIDRIIDALGYTRGNLQKLTNRDNVLKEHARRKQVKFDYELATRRRLNAYESAEHAAEDEGRSVYRYELSGGPPGASTSPPDIDDVPY